MPPKTKSSTKKTSVPSPSPVAKKSSHGQSKKVNDELKKANLNCPPLNVTKKRSPPQEPKSGRLSPTRAETKAHHTVRPYLPNTKTAPTSISDSTVNDISERMANTEGDEHESAKHALLWKLMSDYIPAEKVSVQSSFVGHIEYTCARSRFSFDRFSAYLATSYSVRDRLIELFNDTQENFVGNEVKQVYYVSLEFLVGRFLRNALLNLGLEDIYREALRGLDISLDDIYSEEYDPGLGNGGLGRLAACFMDSLATMNYPGWGYGLMYSFGMFKQTINPDGSQNEVPDYWLNYGDPWRVKKPTVAYNVTFNGHCDGTVWRPSVTIRAMANDFLIPGFNTDNTLALRLWSSKPTSELDEGKFREGDYYEAIAHKQQCENLTSVLYPNDNTQEGKEMRLMQQYLLASATLQDIIRRLKEVQRKDIRELPTMAAIQLNDTHPTIMIVELIRMLVDQERFEFQEALDMTRQVFSYTCHTLMPEALEKWSVPMFERILPRHLQLIYQLNQSFLDDMRYRYQCSDKILRSLSIIEESEPKQVRMANLAVIGSHVINGVAVIHSDLMKKYVFKDFATFWPDKFQNKTNGVTIRRWLHHCNPQLSALITQACGNEHWVCSANELKAVLTKLDNSMYMQQWSAVKFANKQKLANYVQATLGIQLNPELQIFDVQVKRIHEYKRQTLNALRIIHKYITIREANDVERAKMQPRAIIIGGKSAPGYFAAKKLIKLVNNIARVVNNDPLVGDLLKVVFFPNYNVSAAEMIIPATDLSEQISTAGTEAAGTSNMKFAMNASLIIGTYDGANIEIGESIGNENVFFFGAKVEEVENLHATAESRQLNPKLARVFEVIRSGLFGDAAEYACVMDPIERGDKYLVGYDFDSYIEAHERVDRIYKDQDTWTKMTMMSTANMGFFSSDRTVEQYANEIWNIQKCPPPIVTPDAALLNGAGLKPGSAGSVRRHFVGQHEILNSSTKSPSESTQVHQSTSKSSFVDEEDDESTIPIAF